MKPILYMMIGIPGCGKSTFAKEFVNSHPNTSIVSRDKIRLSLLKPEDAYFSKEKEVYQLFSAIIYNKLRTGTNVIADATHLNIGARRKLITTLALDYKFSQDNYDIIYVWIDTPLSVCIERDKLRTGREHVTAEKIREMLSWFKAPKENEFYNLKEVWHIEHFSDF